MTVYWNFRRILNVDPGHDKICVGIAKTAKGGPRQCGNQLGENDLLEGSRLLDGMNQTRSYSEALANLEELAGLLLCKQQHNRENRPHLNQINEVQNRWYNTAKEAWFFLEKEAEIAAERRATRELSLMREAAQLMRDELEREKDDMTVVEVAEVSHGITPDMLVRQVPEDDPFIISAVENTATRNTPKGPAVSQATNIEWPVVPLHAPSRKIPVFSDQHEDGRQPVLCAEAAHANISGTKASDAPKDQRTVASSAFRILKSDENTSLDLSFKPKDRNATSSRLASTSSPVRRVALKNKSAAINKIMTKQTGALTASESTYAFGATMPQSSFSFGVPKQPHVETVPITAPAVEIPRHSTEATEEALHLESNTNSQDSSVLSEDLLESPKTARPASFGYAVVTPDSTRYKTYLPAQQQHGIMTPPDTPEAVLGALQISSPLPPPKLGNYFPVDSDASVSPKITRKPPPLNPSVDVAECRIDGDDVRTVQFGDAESRHEKSGCLSRFVAGQWRSKLVGNVRSMKGRLSSLVK